MSKPANVECSNACAMMIVDAPSPHPTSATSRPPELVDHAVERGQPRVDEVGGVAGTEQPHDAGEQPLVVGVPADPCPVRNASTNASWSA
jgi:hypothetical protein